MRETNSFKLFPVRQLERMEGKQKGRKKEEWEVSRKEGITGKGGRSEGR